MPIAPGSVRLRCSDPVFDRTYLLGESPPKITGGVGGWETVARPRQSAMTIWQGTDPFALEISVMLDGWDPGTQGGGYSQEPDLRALLAAARGDEESEPSTWDIDGIPWLPADEWVLNGIEPGDAVIRRTSDFSRTRQDLTLSFVEYVPPEYVQIRAKARQGAKGKTTIYTVRKGDTPASIARKRRCKWTEIRDLNKALITKGAKQALKPGTRIRVPVLVKPARKTVKRKPAKK